MTTTGEQQPINTSYEIFILALSVLSIFNLMLEILPIGQDVKDLVEVIDWALTPIFLFDFLTRLIRAPSKQGYLLKGGGWLDFIGSLPIYGLRIARLFRMWRVYHGLRRIGMRNIWHSFLVSRAQSALLTILFLTVIVLEFAGIFVLVTERNAPDANIKTPSDALWWAYVTVTTVGYGDRYPVTNSGRIVGVLLMTIGVGLFGVLTGYLANAFLKPTSNVQSATDNQKAPDNGSTAVNDLGAVLEEIRTILLEQERITAEMQKRLDTLDGKQEIVIAEMNAKLGEIGGLLHKKIE